MTSCSSLCSYSIISHMKNCNTIVQVVCWQAVRMMELSESGRYIVTHACTHWEGMRRRSIAWNGPHLPQRAYSQRQWHQFHCSLLDLLMLQSGRSRDLWCVFPVWPRIPTVLEMVACSLFAVFRSYENLKWLCWVIPLSAYNLSSALSDVYFKALSLPACLAPSQ